MGWVVQINPTSDVHHIQHKLYELLRPHMTDFELIYTAVEPSDALTATLAAYEPASDEERTAIGQIKALLDNGEEVELLFGY